MDPILSHVNAVQKSTPCFKIRFNIILRFMTRYFNSSSPISFSHQTFVYRINFIYFLKQYKPSRADIMENMNYGIQDFKVPWHDPFAALVSDKIAVRRKGVHEKEEAFVLLIRPFPLQVEKSQLRSFPHRDHERLTVQLSLDVLELHVGPEGQLELTCVSTIPEFLGQDHSEYADRKISSVIGMGSNRTDWKTE